MEEDAQQRITYLLQEIDANICAAHRSATQICSTVRRHHQILRQIHDATQAWKPLFESFSHQPVVRRPPPTPAVVSARARLTPSSRAFKKSRRSRASSISNNGEGVYDDGTEDEEDSYAYRLDERNVYDDDDDDDDDDALVVGDQLFKTTTLVEHTERSVHDSFNVSLASDNLPQMARTSYIPTPAFHSQSRAQHDASSINTEERSNWSPAMSSPMRTGVLQSDQRRAGGRAIPTPDSAISSVAPTSPISKNLMKMGAFEFTPPRGSTTSLSQQQQYDSEQQQEHEQQSNTPSTPEIPTFATRDTLAPQSPTLTPRDTASPRETPSARKRKRADSSAAKASSSTVYPKTHYPVNPVAAATSPGMGSPSWRSPGKPFANLRRKYSTGGTYLTPTKFREVESRASIEASAARASENLLADDEPVTPPLDLVSPLLRTQLKAMTPLTPLSNRLVGATLDIGSMSQESKLQDYDDSFNAGEPAPEFQIALLPAAFQRGVGAVQISTLYSKFRGLDNASLPTFSVDQLAEKLPDYGKEKIEVMLDTLVSRRLLRPFVVEGTLFWQLPA